MYHPREIVEHLRSTLALYRSLLTVVESENSELRRSEPPELKGNAEVKKGLLPRLVASLDPLAKCRSAWQTTGPAERARHPEIGDLVRQNQDLLMKILMLDRENEQALLRHGLVPARELPSVNRQRPHFVSDLYRQQGSR